MITARVYMCVCVSLSLSFFFSRCMGMKVYGEKDEETDPEGHLGVKVN